MVRGKRARWDTTAIRGLREHLQMTQQELSDELGVRQQTISDWETGQYSPRGSSVKILSVVAERVGFRYDADDG